MAYKFKSNIVPDFDAEDGKQILIEAVNIGYGQTTVKAILDALGGGFSMFVGATLPQSGESNILYLIKSPSGDYYIRYIWLNDGWQSLGTTETAIVGGLDQSMVGPGSSLKLENGKLVLKEDMEPGQDGKSANVMLKRTYTKPGETTREFEGEYNAEEEDQLVAEGYTIDCRLITWTGDVGVEGASDKSESPNLMADVNRVLEALTDITGL